MKKIVISCIFLFFIIIGVFLFFTKNSSADTSLQSKTEKQIEQLEQKIVAMMNSLNQITLSNSVLIEEKTEKTNQNSQGSENTQQSSGGSQEQGGGNSGGSSDSTSSSNSNSSSSGASNSDNNKESTSSNNTKYEVKNDSILVNKDENINWDNIKTNVETIHYAWANLTIDLHGLNVNNENILSFSNVLDQVTISAKQEDKIATLNNLASLYAFFPNYIEQISDDNEKININYTKACILNSYALAEQNKWEEMKIQVSNAINYFTNILNSVNEDRQKQNGLSKIYVLLNELNNSIDLKDKDLYMIKYRNVMEELANFK